MRRLTIFSRFIIALVGLLLVPLYFVPLWSIRLIAPQYPEGLGMYLWAGKITGHGIYDLQNINLLNHYIGMAPIIEESIPEFAFMPYILGYVILGALVTFIYPRRFMVKLGLANLILVGAAGFYDFWRWEYNYGHNLNPEAPISIPGLSYQPPLIGCKQLLNIEACSWPHIGGILLFVVGILLVVVAVTERGAKDETKNKSKKNTSAGTASGAVGGP